ncbi:hypothetical protein AVEN_117262-1 [Araneus ventricosus]|uniref:Uncharacterized protein n=1 Tax=Araneus ventricosus TaxID=182803 RepID=A0A4Y2AY94_ARAVE|nr:hypothetical protein AVEN_117262-1 [Araneus ventricosus]
MTISVLVDQVHKVLSGGGIANIDWTPDGLRGNQQYHTSILTTLYKRVWLFLWEMAFIPGQFFSPYFSVCQDFSAKHGIPVVEYLPYSPDLTLWDSLLFPMLRSELTAIRFQTAVKAKATW